MRATADKLNATFPHGFSPPREVAKATDITAESFQSIEPVGRANAGDGGWELGQTFNASLPGLTR
jgi:hypothetical protein